MSENFNKLKRKFLIIAIAVSAVLGALCAIAATCVLAVVFKRTAVEFGWYLYIPIAVGFAAAFGGIFFIFLRPTDKKTAKKIDSDYALNQKAQTMVEYAHSGDAMAVMQREQADAAIGEAAKKPVNLKWLLKFAFIPVLALAMLFVGIFIPAKKTATTVTPPPPYDITAGQETALKALIEDVKASTLSEESKQSVTEVLGNLLEGLRTTKEQSVMRAAVISSVKMIDNIIASANSYVKTAAALKDGDGLLLIDRAIVEGVTFFRTGGVRITTFDGVKEKDAESDVQIGGKLDGWGETFAEQLCQKTEDKAPLPVAEAYAKVDAFIGALTGKLAASGVEETDGLYSALKAFTDGLKAINRNGMSPEAYHNSVKNVLQRFSSDGASALSVQAYACMMDEYVRNALARIFNISVSDFGTNENVVPNDSSSDKPDDDPNNSSDGFHGGSIHIGNDLVLDVDTGELVAYGKLLDKYNDKVNEYIAAGVCSEELAIYIRQYFGLLYRGTEEAENA